METIVISVGLGVVTCFGIYLFTSPFQSESKINSNEINQNISSKAHVLITRLEILDNSGQVVESLDDSFLKEFGWNIHSSVALNQDIDIELDPSTNPSICLLCFHGSKLNHVSTDYLIEQFDNNKYYVKIYYTPLLLNKEIGIAKSSVKIQLLF